MDTDGCEQLHQERVGGSLLCLSPARVCVAGGYDTSGAPCAGGLEEVRTTTAAAGREEEEGQWTEETGAEGLHPRVMARFVTARGGAEVWAFGGVREGCMYNDLWRMRAETGAWECVDDGEGSAPAPEERADFGMVALGDGDGESDMLLALVGGQSATGSLLDDVWVFRAGDPGGWVRVSIPDEDGVCEQLPADRDSATPPWARSPGTRGGFAMASVGSDRVLLFGGTQFLGMEDDEPVMVPMNDLWLLQLHAPAAAADEGTVTGTWTQILLDGLAPSPRSQSVMIPVDDTHFLLVGGFGLKEEAGDNARDSAQAGDADEGDGTLVGCLGDLWCADLDAGRWSTLTAPASTDAGDDNGEEEEEAAAAWRAHLLQPRTGHTAAVLKPGPDRSARELLVYGGFGTATGPAAPVYVPLTELMEQLTHIADEAEGAEEEPEEGEGNDAEIAATAHDEDGAGDETAELPAAPAKDAPPSPPTR